MPLSTYHRRIHDNGLKTWPIAIYRRSSPSGCRDYTEKCGQGAAISRVYHQKRMTEVPSPLAHSSARLLEFDALLRVLGGFAGSAAGRERVARLAPSNDSGWI